MDTTEERYFYRWKKEVLHTKEVKERMLKQIQHLLVENKQLHDELTEANRTIEVYIDKNSLSTPYQK